MGEEQDGFITPNELRKLRLRKDMQGAMVLHVSAKAYAQVDQQWFHRVVRGLTCEGEPNTRFNYRKRTYESLTKLRDGDTIILQPCESFAIVKRKIIQITPENVLETVKYMKRTHYKGATDNTFVAPTKTQKKAWKKNRAQLLCDYCTTPRAVLKICTGCRVVRYCDRQCQKADWGNGHRSVCNTAR